jgi:hypothetical protein
MTRLAEALLVSCAAILAGILTGAALVALWRLFV